MQHTAPTPTQPRRPNARTFEGRQRQRVHALKRTLGYSEGEYRTMLYGITGNRYARDLSESQLTHVIAVLSEFALERERAEQPNVETDQERYEREQDELISMLAGF
jgi:hypothetical protein